MSGLSDRSTVPPRHVVLYDADCGFCKWLLSKLLAWDRRQRLSPVALQAPEARTLLPGMAEEERMDSWHLVSPDGEVRSAGAAVAPLARLLPAGRPFAILTSSAPGLTARLYDWTARHRAGLAHLLPPGAAARADARIARRVTRRSHRRL